MGLADSSTPSQQLQSRPNGYAAIIEACGDITAYVDAAGNIREKAWGSRLTLVDFPTKRRLSLSWDPLSSARCARVHLRIADATRNAFQNVEDAGLWRKLGSYGGAYNFRRQRGSASKISTHAFGLAIDVDCEGERNALGTDPVVDPGIVQAFEAAGFYWGGRFSRPDGMHFQFAEGY